MGNESAIQRVSESTSQQFSESRAALFWLHRKVQWIPFQSRREVGFVDAPLRFGFRQNLHDRHAVAMRVEHDLYRFGIAEEENADEDVRHEIHRRYIIVVDEDAVKRLQFDLLVGGDFDIGSGLRVDGHAGDYSITKTRLFAETGY